MSGEERGSPHGRYSDGEEEVQLRPLRPADHCIEAQVQPGDTLQALALRFHCPISELKRINNIHKDNEIFARRTIKLPVTPYSVLTEVLPSLSPAPMPSTSATCLRQDRLPGVASGEHVIDYNAAILNSQIAPAGAGAAHAHEEPGEPAAEDTQLIPGGRARDNVETVVVKQLTSQGADLGIKWHHLLLCVLVLGVVIPLVYVMFYLDKHEHSEVHALAPERPPPS